MPHLLVGHMSNRIRIVACPSTLSRTERRTEIGVVLYPNEANLRESVAHHLFDLRLVVSGHQERELVTVEVVCDGLEPRQDRSGLSEHIVSGLMTNLVVHLLEAIEIEIYEGERGLQQREVRQAQVERVVVA
jgi:hypothetical protein